MALISFLDKAPYRIGRVALVVRDLDRLTQFYCDLLGFVTISRDAGNVRLGVDATVLLELRHEPAARPWRASEAGLFHTAFLLPRRGDLGAWLAHVAARGLPLSGSADHLVSEAVYLNDPEGNGIEIYVDRPSSAWPQAQDGSVVMHNAPLDYAGLAHATTAPWAGMPSGGRIGHVHLQVGALEAAERFYVDALGFDVTCRYPGATFLGAGGYHHQLATNIWNSRNAPVRSSDMAGLAEIEIVAEPRTLAAAWQRVRQDAFPIEKAGEGLTLCDPWGTRLHLTEEVASD